MTPGGARRTPCKGGRAAWRGCGSSASASARSSEGRRIDQPFTKWRGRRSAGRARARAFPRRRAGAQAARPAAAAGAAPGAPAPHAHLIVDDEVALTVSDATRPVFVRGIKEGPHSLRIVLCRPWHEVVKARGAFALTRFWVGTPPEGKKGRAAELLAWPDPKKPMLTYVLPLSVPPPGGPELASPEPDGSAAVPDPAKAEGPAASPPLPSPASPS